MKKAFTLMEILVVIIIIGVLATLGFTQYRKMIEKGRSVEAKMNLGILRILEMEWAEDHNGDYTADIGEDGLDSGLPPGDNDACEATNTNYYFEYGCSQTTGACGAFRCASNGKRPAAGSGYLITLDIDGTFSGTAGYY